MLTPPSCPSQELSADEEAAAEMALRCDEARQY